MDMTHRGSWRKHQLLRCLLSLSQMTRRMSGLLILPYYDAVPYADLSDFFYVWLKRSLSDEPLFQDLLTQKIERLSKTKRRLRWSKQGSRLFRETHGRSVR